MDKTEKYLNKTGQTVQYLMSGASQYGPDFIDSLVEKALKEDKKIIWIDKPVEGVDLGQLDFELQPL